MNGQLRELVRQKIIDVLAEDIPEMTRRDIHLPRVPKKAVVVIGMRRTGKTTVLWQVMSDRLSGGTPREGLLFFSFEDERLAGMTTNDLDLIVDEYYRMFPDWRDRRCSTFLLDEIQLVPGWEMFTRRLLDSEEVDLFLSGSSARLLSREIGTSMRGRAMEALVHPFSFREYLRHIGREPSHEPDRLPKAARSTIERDLRLYLTEGGFPEAVGIVGRDRADLLRGYVDVALLRDVIERYEISHPIVLRWMARQLLGNAAGSFSINKFYRDLRSQGFSVGKETLHEYLLHLEDAFLIRATSIATDSERRRMVNPRKAYPIDPGLIPIFDRSGKANVGHALETCVILELERRGAAIAYVRTKAGHEVDFLAQYVDGREELIQVCADIATPQAFDREVRALQAAKEEYRHATLHLITLQSGTGLELPRNIRHHTATTWLLETPGG